jgi:DNA-directed RNA polymerase specialized sigma24 family protein
MWAKVYDKKYRVNMKTGKNFDKVMSKIEPLVNKLAKEYTKSFDGMAYEDLKQEIFVMALEAIRNYDQNKGVKLSTFLHVHLNNKLISMYRAKHAQKHGASILTIEEQQGERLNFYAISPRSLSFHISAQRGAGESSQALDVVPENGKLFYAKNDFEKIDFRLSLESLIEKYKNRVDPITRKCIEDIYFKDMTIVDSIPLRNKKKKTKVLSGWAMSMRLKKLEKLFKDLKLNSKVEEIPSQSSLNKIFYIQ